MTSAEARRGFHGGSLSAWLSTLARNKAIDFLRRQRREEASDERNDRAQRTRETTDDNAKHAPSREEMTPADEKRRVPRQWPHSDDRMLVVEAHPV